MPPQPLAPLSRAEARAVDALAINQLHVPGLLLMENAARGCVDELERRGIDGPVTICCGVGNNGGDGYAMARQLLVRGAEVRVAAVGDAARQPPDAAVNAAIWRALGRVLELHPQLDAPCWGELQAYFDDSAWIVDALLGTGARGPLRPPMDRLVSLINAAPARRLAVDVPSGLDCDRGTAADPTVRAEVTCTFVAPKAGFATGEAQRHLGDVVVVDIGVPSELLWQRVHAAGGLDEAPPPSTSPAGG